MRVFLFAILVSLGATTAIAKDGNDPFAVCRADLDRLCKNVKAGDGRQVQCMMDNRAKASPDCAAVLNKKHEKEQEMKRNKVKHEQEQQGKPVKVKQ